MQVTWNFLSPPPSPAPFFPSLVFNLLNYGNYPFPDLFETKNAYEFSNRYGFHVHEKQHRWHHDLWAHSSWQSTVRISNELLRSHTNTNC
jgi:hypothetical protein